MLCRYVTTCNPIVCCVMQLAKLFGFNFAKFEFGARDAHEINIATRSWNTLKSKVYVITNALESKCM